MSLKKIADLPKELTCTSTEHSPPHYMVFSDGIYEWTCPVCGHVTQFTVHNPRWLNHPHLSFFEAKGEAR